MKLLVVSHSCATASNQQIYAELERITGWKVTIVVPDRWRDEFGRTLDDRPWPSFRGEVLKIPVVVNGSIIMHAYRCDWRKLLERGSFDAVYVNHEPYALAAAQVVYAVSCYGNTPIGFYSCQNIQKSYPPPFRWMERMVYRRCSFGLPITEEVSSVLRAKGFSGALDVCPLPFDSERYRPRLPAEWPTPLRRPEGQVMIGYVGRLVEAKGLRTLACALGHLRDLDWRLAIIGSGPFETEFRCLLDRAGVLGRCSNFGFVPHEETPAYMSALDILVLPSETQRNWKEQFGRVIPEALASGAAVVGSSSGEIPNLVRSSRGGRIFAERDISALASELRSLITDANARSKHAAAGRTWAVEGMALAPVATRMANAIERAIQRRRNG